MTLEISTFVHDNVIIAAQLKFSGTVLAHTLLVVEEER